jgi:LytS/YehU family sensor histidine kinase
VKFMKSEYKALNALMNPHFIFNTLNNVQSLVNGNNKLAANEYLRIFADLVRQNMHNVSKELITLQKEIDLVNNYLLLEKLRFEDKLNFDVHIDAELELFEIMVPPLLIQPLVENSIKHGILPLKSPDGFIQINITEQNDLLVIEIKDNGVGLNNALAQPGSLHESYGLSNIRKRIEQLSMILDKKLQFNMEEVFDERTIRWTVVTITMPL